MPASDDNPYEAPQTTDLQPAKIPVAESVGTRKLLPEYSTKQLAKFKFRSGFLRIHAIILMVVFIAPVSMLVVWCTTLNRRSSFEQWVEAILGILTSLICTAYVYLAIVALDNRPKWGWHYGIVHHLLLLLLLLYAIVLNFNTGLREEPVIVLLLLFVLLLNLVSFSMLFKLRPIFTGEYLIHASIVKEYRQRIKNHVE